MLLADKLHDPCCKLELELTSWGRMAPLGAGSGTAKTLPNTSPAEELMLATQLQHDVSVLFCTRCTCSYLSHDMRADNNTALTVKAY